MTLDQFAALLDRFGGRQQDWPEADRADAEHLLAISDEAVALLAAELRTETLMRRGDPAHAVGADAVIRLSNAVFARLPPKQVRRRPWLRAALEAVGLALGAGREWGPRFATSVAAAAVLGIITGGLLPAGQQQQQQVSAASLLAMSTTYLPMDAR